jgi:hypothetical protein
VQTWHAQAAAPEPCASHPSIRSTSPHRFGPPARKPLVRHGDTHYKTFT